MNNKILIVIFGALMLHLIIITVVLFEERTERIEGTDIKPIEDQRTKEVLINELYWNDITNCNQTRELFNIQSKDSEQVVIGEFTSVNDWYDNCVYFAEEKKVFYEKELLK